MANQTVEPLFLVDESDPPWSYHFFVGYRFSAGLNFTLKEARYECESTAGGKLAEIDGAERGLSWELAYVRFLIKRFQARGTLPETGELFVGES